MSDLLEKCTVCHALLDEEDLFCANCGTETPHRATAHAHSAPVLATHNFECEGCGASMSYDASARTLRCPFCGSERLEKKNDVKVLRPSRVVPFVCSEAEAHGHLRRWLGGSFWRPGDLARTAVVTNLRQVYVPYWVFGARVFTYWTADTSHTPPGARADWYPLSGEHHGHYSGVLVGASGVLAPAETSALCPFDLSKGVSPDEVDLENVVYEQFRVQRKYARPLAQQGLEELERGACRQFVPGNCRNMKVNVRLEGLTAEPILLPVWMMAYRYRSETYRFLVNGQTGRSTGTAPFSWQKAAGVAALVIVAVILLAICMGLAGVWASAARDSLDDRSVRPTAKVASVELREPQVDGSSPRFVGGWRIVAEEHDAARLLAASRVAESATRDALQESPCPPPLILV